MSEDERMADYQKFCNDRVTFRDGRAFPKHETEGKYYVGNGEWVPVQLGVTTPELMSSIGYVTPDEALRLFLADNNVSSLEELAVLDGFATIPDVNGWVADEGFSSAAEMIKAWCGTRGTTAEEDLAEFDNAWGGMTIEEAAISLGFADSAEWVADEGFSSVAEMLKAWYGTTESAAEDDLAAFSADCGGRTIEEAAISMGFGTSPDLTAWAENNGYETPEAYVIASVGAQPTYSSENALEIADRSLTLDPALLQDIANTYIGLPGDFVLFANRMGSFLREDMYDTTPQAQQDAFYTLLTRADSWDHTGDINWNGLDLSGRSLEEMRLGSSNLTAAQINQASSIMGAYFHYKDMTGVTFAGKDISSLHLYGARGITAANVASAAAVDWLDLRGTGITQDALAAAFVAAGKPAGLASSSNIHYGNISNTP